MLSSHSSASNTEQWAHWLSCAHALIWRMFLQVRRKSTVWMTLSKIMFEYSTKIHWKNKRQKILFNWNRIDVPNFQPHCVSFCSAVVSGIIGERLRWASIIWSRILINIACLQQSPIAWFHAQYYSQKAALKTCRSMKKTKRYATDTFPPFRTGSLLSSIFSLGNFFWCSAIIFLSHSIFFYLGLFNHKLHTVRCGIA